MQLDEQIKAIKAKLVPSFNEFQPQEFEEWEGTKLNTWEGWNPLIEGSSRWTHLCLWPRGWLPVGLGKRLGGHKRSNHQREKQLVEKLWNRLYYPWNSMCNWTNGSNTLVAWLYYTILLDILKSNYVGFKIYLVWK